MNDTASEYRNIECCIQVTKRYIIVFGLPLSPDDVAGVCNTAFSQMLLPSDLEGATIIPLEEIPSGLLQLATLEVDEDHNGDKNFAVALVSRGGEVTKITLPKEKLPK